MRTKRLNRSEVEYLRGSFELSFWAVSADHLWRDARGDWWPSSSLPGPRHPTE